MLLPRDLDIRDLAPRHAHALTVLMCRCLATYRGWAPAGWEPPDPGQEQATLSARLAEPARWWRGAFAAGGRLVGTLSWVQFEDPAEGAEPGIAHLSAVFVDPARWRQGIASALLDEAEQAMLERGYDRARLWTPAGAPARRFYEARGWRHDGRRMWHERWALHHVGYEKRLAPRG